MLPAILIFALLCGLRLVNMGGNINPDAIYYVLASQRMAEGRVAESMSAMWMPLVSWLASPLVALGAPPVHAVLAINISAALATLFLLYRAALRVAGPIPAQCAAIALACDPQFLSWAVAPSSESLFVLLAFSAFICAARGPLCEDSSGLATANNSLRHSCTALMVLGCFLLLVRVAALPLVILLAVPLWLSEKRTWPRIWGRATLYGSAIALLLLGLSLFFYQRTGLFQPSPNWYLNRFFVSRDFIGGDYTGAHYGLFDGRNTVEGDVQTLEAGRSLPGIPPVPMARRMRYLAECIEGFVRGLGALAAAPVLGFAALGAWQLARDRRWQALIWAVAWSLAVTIGMIFSTIQQRYFLPLLPLAYLLAALGLSTVYKEFTWRRLPVLTAAGFLIVNLASGFRESGAYALLAKGPPRPHPDAGEFIRSNFGADRRILTPTDSLANLASAANSAGYWKPLPVAPAEEIWKYMREKRIEFVIVPNRQLREVDSPVLRHTLELHPGASMVWQNLYEEVWRIDRPL